MFFEVDAVELPARTSLTPSAAMLALIARVQAAR
jgi:hypothetical protein